MTDVLLSLGSNIEPRIQRIEEAVRFLKETLSAVVISHFYETEPVGYTEQAAFINVCLTGHTSATVFELRDACSSIEQRLGRIHRAKWHQREIDIDVVLFGADVVDTAELTIPHPRFRDRAFVLVPAAEIASEFVDPVTGATIASLLQVCADPAAVVQLDSSIAKQP